MTIPDPLPLRFTASLRGRIRALLAHSLLDGDRQSVEAPAEVDAPLSVRVEVDREAGTLRLLAFPEIEDEVGTAIGDVRAVVSVDGEAAGSYDDPSGHANVEVPLRFDAKSLLARDSSVRVSLTTDGAVDQPGLRATGDPFEAGDPTVRLVGHGTFEGGSLDGGTLWLVVDGEIEAVAA